MPKIRFIEPGGKVHEIEAAAGACLLDIAQAANIDIEGACEGSMACSTCHVIVDAAWYDRLEAPRLEEEDMLDLAYGLTRTSRLCCQIMLTDELDGLVVTLPSETHNMML